MDPGQLVSLVAQPGIDTGHFCKTDITGLGILKGFLAGDKDSIIAYKFASLIHLECCKSIVMI